MEDYGHLAAVAQAVAFASSGALAAQLWELMLYFTDEVEYLWRGKMNFVKVLYFGARYALLVAQAVSLALTHISQNAEPPDIKLCILSFVYKSALAQFAVSWIEFILLVRVYALYNRSWRVKYFLITVQVLAITLESTGSGIVMKELLGSTSCIKPPKAPARALIPFGLGAGLCQFVVISMTLAKFLMNGQHGFLRTPLTSLMLREGLFAFFLILGMLSAIIAYETVRNLGLAIGYAAFSWLVALLSMGGCRLILNMRKLAATAHQQTWDDEEMTSMNLTGNEDSICLTTFRE
ncbi:hypothetical protein B0H34DRAFT_265045 [Crassisporium funariophilum]|nr:hypothetical protein B0H34DRAFT_265045 [Crassisporium funariophilum]